jgi:hypothetical protein
VPLKGDIVLVPVALKPDDQPLAVVNEGTPDLSALYIR